MNAIVLTYHSHHVLGPQYHLNDHIAFPLDLEVITQHGYDIVPLATIVAQLQAPEGDRNYVALTFDDGPIYDIDDFVHPQMGLQRSFVGAMRDFLASPLGKRQPNLSATSFVIASPEARYVIETTFDAQYTYLGLGSMRERWWDRGIATGLLSIANHSWDHLHPALPRVAHSKQVRADFTQVLSDEDADAQILAASRYIAQQTDNRAAPFFAYPFGHFNSFLTDSYLPDKGNAAGVQAAFTTEPRAISASDNVYRLPRYICGHHWKSSEELSALLSQ